jgi:hypothetical protein
MLARRPVQRATADHVQVQVKDRLACARARIDHGAVTRLRQALLVGDARGDAQQMAERRFVAPRSVVERLQMLARDDERMDGRLWVDVAKRHRAIILIDYVGGNLARDNLTKDAIWFSHKLNDRQKRSLSVVRGQLFKPVFGNLCESLMQRTTDY